MIGITSYTRSLHEDSLPHASIHYVLTMVNNTYYVDNAYRMPDKILITMYRTMALNVNHLQNNELAHTLYYSTDS